MTWGKYWVVIANAAARARIERTVFVGRLAFYAVMLVIYARIWQMVGAQGQAEPFGRSELVWYLALTEWIALSVPPLHNEIEADIRSGNIAYYLPRPISYFWMRYAEGLGTLFVRMAVLLPLGFALAAVLSGGLPLGGALGLVCGALTALIAAGLQLLFLAIIGLSAFFIQDTAPIYWVWQKLSFVFGGLMFPLDLYPDTLQKVAGVTPFPWLLYAPGRVAIGAEPAFLWKTTLALATWLVISVFVGQVAYRRALKSLEFNGG